MQTNIDEALEDRGPQDTFLDGSTHHNMGLNQTQSAARADNTNSNNAESDTSFGSQCSKENASLVSIKISYDMTPYASTLSALHPICRICQNPNEKNNILISPCRCDGTLKHVHGTCLRKWIEMQSRRRMYEYRCKCELCGYQYKKRKFIKCTEWRLPRMTGLDKALHIVFLVSLVVMIACAVITIQCLISDSGGVGASKYRLPNGERSYLSIAEVVTLSCGVVFFVTFIVAMTVEIKAKHTIYEIIRKVIRYNTVWLIENYEKSNDALYYNSLRGRTSKKSFSSDV